MKKSYTRSKSTRRFNFQVSRNSTSHKSGANIFTIKAKDYDTSESSRGYSTTTGGFQPGQDLVMTVKEAKALQGFLNNTFAD